MRIRFLILLLATCVAGDVAWAVDTIPAGTFSRAEIGSGLPSGWRVVDIKGRKPSAFRLVAEAGKTVLEVRADASAASLVREIRVDPSAHPYLRWRWRIENRVAGSDIRTKQGDDFPARLYVLFDYPLDRLSLIDRGKLRLARAIYGDQVPAAALCYVWDGKAAAGTSAWNAYTDRVRMIVVGGRGAPVGEWSEEERNVAEDFRNAFGEEPPPIAGIAVAADTDQTGERAVSRFGDILFSARPGTSPVR